MKKTATLRLCSLFVLVVFLFPGLAEAALSARYEKKVGSAAAPAPVVTAPKKTPAPVPPAPKQQKPAPSETSVHIPGTYIKVMQKEHKTFAKTFIDAEMGLRYYIKLCKEDVKLTDAQRKAVHKELQKRLKALEKSAGRYARNIRNARLAYEGMNEKERPLFAAMLSSFFATPAWADDRQVMGILGGMERALYETGSVAGGTVQLPYGSDSTYSIASDFVNATADFVSDSWDKFKGSHTGQVMATGAQLAATAAGTVVGAALSVGAIVSAPATMGGSLIVGASAAALTVGVCAGTISTTTALDDFVQAVNDDPSQGLLPPEAREVLDETFKTVSVVNMLVNLPGLATSGSKAEVVQGVLGEASDAMTFWDGELEKASDPKIDALLKNAGQKPRPTQFPPLPEERGEGGGGG